MTASHYRYQDARTNSRSHVGARSGGQLADSVCVDRVAAVDDQRIGLGERKLGLVADETRPRLSGSEHTTSQYAPWRQSSGAVPGPAGRILVGC